MFHCDCLYRDGGGVALLIKGCLAPINIPSNLHLNGMDIDIVTCDLLKLKPSGMICRIIALYCSYTLSADSMWQVCTALSNFMSTPNCAFILVGDFNVLGLNWTTMVSSCCSDDILLEFCAQNNLSQSVFKPTRRKNILDLVLCSVSISIINTQV